MADEKKSSVDKKSGRRDNQKMKAYYVYDYLMRNTDATHLAKMGDIKAYLEGLGIKAERRSIYRDIEDINKAILITTRNKYGLTMADTIKKATRLLQDKKNHTIVYDEKRQGYYVRQRQYKSDDIQLLAECVYSAKFIDEKRAEKLTHIVCSLVSEHDADIIEKDVFLANRTKGEDTTLYDTVTKINMAMKSTWGKKTHVPEKIKFKYLEYFYQDGIKRRERRRNEWYVVSPYKLLINEGYYYLIGYDDKNKKILHYRLDRMKDVELTALPREGLEEFEKLSMETYLQEHSSMFGGKTEHVTLRVMNHAIEPIIDRFGIHGAVYSKDGDDFFKVHVTISVSKQFYGWLFGLGNQAKIVSPEWVAKDYKEHIQKIARLY